MSVPTLVLDKVFRSFKEGAEVRHVLKGAHLTVRPGEFVALLGRSGAGKSTLLNIIGGLDVADSGRVEVEGQLLNKLTDDQRTELRASRMGFVFQSFNLIPTLTAQDNVALPLILGGRSMAEAEAEARKMLARVGLEGRGKSAPDRLSGGEQQRVAIARALIHDPVLVLADEPTGNLDYETGREIMDLLHGMVQQRKVSMLVVTHDTDFLGVADRILRLQEGTLTRVSQDDVRSGKVREAQA